jgi:hypothetical protein
MHESPRSSRRTVLRALGLSGWAALSGRSADTARAAAEPRLFVFVPTFERPRAVGEALTAGLPGLSITTFGRFADFSAAIAGEKPEGVLALGDTLSALGIEVALQGTVRGDAEEPYVALSKDREETVESVATRVIGAVDVVGRSELPGLVQRLLGAKHTPEVRRVLKVGDLLALLHLDLATVLLLPERFQAELQKQSQLALRPLHLRTAHARRTALGFPGGKPEPTMMLSLKRAPSTVQALLGAEVWR